jgi:hypothetical protein
MTSKIKVDNIENQCGGAVVTKCGGTTTITGSVVKANNIQASDAGNIISQSGTTITLGASGDTINLASGASQSGFGRTGTVDWITTPKTTGTFTAVSGEGYFLNTSGGVITANLPAGVAGAIVSFADYAATWQTSNVTVTPNGTEKIGGANADATLNTEGQSVTFVFVDSTQGWINTMDSTSNVRGVNVLCASVSGAGNTLVTAPCCANVKIATFTGPGDFTVNTVSDVAAENTIGYMIVAGAGGGGGKPGCSLSNFENGAGGGAGGFREGRNVPVDNFTASPLVANSPTNAITLTAQTYPVVVGAGGAGTPYPSTIAATRGSLSSFAGLTSAGGGGGGGPNSSLTPGGSGGGEQNWGGGCNPTGNTPPVSPAQGFGGGAGAQNATGGGGPGGGGGAGELGHNGSGTSAGQGGVGVSNSITGSSVGRAGGGGGSSPGAQPGSSCGSGGNGGGNNPGGNGATNRGGGGGGSGQCGASGSGGNGGSGIVVIRYKFQ